jgi:hypothetical protein
MSEKIQEFIEVPQEFIREGNQVRHSAIDFHWCLIRHTFHSFLFDAQNPLEKVYPILIIMPVHIFMRHFDARRIYSDFQGCRNRFRCHGIYRLLG